MPLKPPSRAITRIIRMIVPIDMQISSSPAVGICCAAFELRNEWELLKFRLLDRHPPCSFLSTPRNYIHLDILDDLRENYRWPLRSSFRYRIGLAGPMLSVDEERWEDDRMIFRVRALGQAASGHVDVADDHVRVEVTLPLLLQRFAEMAQIAIRKRGSLLLG